MSLEAVAQRYISIESSLAALSPVGAATVFRDAAALAAAYLSQREALRTALAHVAELHSAWARGAIRECDGQGGTRSNRNVSVEMALRKALEE